MLALVISAVAYTTLWLRSGIAHPAHAALAVGAFAAIYIGIGALVGAFITGPLEGSLLVVMAFSVDVFSGPAMTSGGGLTLTPTRKAADLLVAAGGGQASPTGDWVAVALTAPRRSARGARGLLVLGSLEDDAMSTNTATATAMAFRDQWRRPLLLILLVIVPAYVVTRSIAITQRTPRTIGLPGSHLRRDRSPRRGGPR